MKRYVVLFVFLAVALAACGKKQFVTQPAMPALAPPPPPERVVAPSEPATAGGEGEEPAKGKQTEKTQTNPSSKARAPATEAPKPVEPPPQSPTPQPEPPKQQLQTVEAKAQEKEANYYLNQAEENLGKVKKEVLLNADAKQQFDTATSFIRQGKLAMSEKNFGLAARLLKNADTILAALASR